MNQDESEQNEVDGMTKGADSTGKLFEKTVHKHNSAHVSSP